MDHPVEAPIVGQYITNPKTNRPVKVGGRMWDKLVNEGILSGDYVDPTELATIEEEEEVEKKISELNETLPIGVHAVRGRGKHSGKIVKRKKQPTTADVIEHTKEVALKVVNENLDHLNECDDLDEELERLILQELSQSKSKPRATKVLKKPTRGKQIKYTTEDLSIRSEESDSSDLSDSSDSSDSSD